MVSLALVWIDKYAKMQLRSSEKGDGDSMIWKQ